MAWPCSPQAGFEFTAASDSAGVPRLDFQVTPGSQGAASGAVLAAPASGQLTVGEPVAVELRVEDCLKGTAEPVTTAIGITVEHADRIETAWTWECDEGNPRIVQVETYQGPLVSRLLVESGDTDGRGGVAVHPQAGRFAVVSVHVEHDSETVPEVAARLAGRDGQGDGQGLDPIGSGAVRLETPDSYGESPFRSELLYRVPAGDYRAGLDVQLAIDPNGRLRESDEGDNEVAVPLPDEGIHRTRPLEVVVVPAHREPGPGETAPTGGVIPPEGVPADAQIQAVVNAHWPAPAVTVRNHESAPDEPEPFALRAVDYGAGLGAWEDALEELVIYRTSQATESPHEFWVGYVEWPEGSEPANAACGLGYNLRGDGAVLSPYRAALINVGCTDFALAHELGHNLGLNHVDAGCGSTPPHQEFPHADGGLGPNRVWDARRNEGAGGFVPGVPGTGVDAPKDVMSYCDAFFTSDHSYREAQRRRISLDGLPAASAYRSLEPRPAASGGGARSLLLAGRVDERGRFSLTRHRLLDKAPKRAAPAGGGRLRLVVEVPGQGLRLERPLLPAYPAHDLDGVHDGIWVDRVPAPVGRSPTLVTIVDPEGRALLREWLFAE